MRILLLIGALALLVACGSDNDAAIESESALASAGLVPESTAAWQKPDAETLPRELMPPSN